MHLGYWMTPSPPCTISDWAPCLLWVCVQCVLVPSQERGLGTDHYITAAVAQDEQHWRCLLKLQGAWDLNRVLQVSFLG